MPARRPFPLHGYLGGAVIVAAEVALVAGSPVVGRWFTLALLVVAAIGCDNRSKDEPSMKMLDLPGDPVGIVEAGVGLECW